WSCPEGTGSRAAARAAATLFSRSIALFGRRGSGGMVSGRWATSAPTAATGIPSASALPATVFRRSWTAVAGEAPRPGAAGPRGAIGRAAGAGSGVAQAAGAAPVGIGDHGKPNGGTRCPFEPAGVGAAGQLRRRAARRGAVRQRGGERLRRGRVGREPA